MNRPSNRPSRAFTLIELLVVVAIIAILAAILFPVFAKARNAAQKVTCLSNLRQYAAATSMYLADYDEVYPPSAVLNGACIGTFYLAIDAYVKNDKVQQCPSEPEAMDIPTMFSGFLAGACPGTPRFTGFSVNKSLFADGFAGATGVLHSSISRPAETIMQYDGNVIRNSTQPVQARHAGAFNASYVDGHVKSIQASEIGASTQFSTTGLGRPIKLHRIGAKGGFYADRQEARGIPQ